MKHFKLILAIGLAALCLASCQKDGAKNSITIDGKTYKGVTAEYAIEGNHFFHLRVELTSDGKTVATGMTDTPMALGENLKGRTVTIDEDFGYGDRLIMSVIYPNGDSYSATPAFGKQTFKQTDNSHYQIIMDTTDEEGKAFKMNVVASKSNVESIYK